MIGGIYQYRGFIWRHARADLRHRYAGTGMGVAWNVIHPLAIITIYSVVFTQIMRPKLSAGAGRLDYTLYLCSGFFPWIAFSDCVVRGCNAFIANATYLKKLPIPEQVFVAQNAAASTLSLCINFLLLLVVSLLLGHGPYWTWLLLPIPIVLMQTLGFGFGLLLGTLNVFFRDISEWVGIAMQLVMWTVPIVYPETILPDWAKSVLAYHPLMPALSTIRDLFIHAQLPSIHFWIGIFFWPAAVGMLAYLVLQKLRPEIRDVI